MGSCGAAGQEPGLCLDRAWPPRRPSDRHRQWAISSLWFLPPALAFTAWSTVPAKSSLRTVVNRSQNFPTASCTGSRGWTKKQKVGLLLATHPPSPPCKAYGKENEFLKYINCSKLGVHFHGWTEWQCPWQISDTDARSALGEESKHVVGRKGCHRSIRKEKSPPSCCRQLSLTSFCSSSKAFT